MRGYCPKCREYRSDNGLDAWRIMWRKGRPTCERCGSYVDVWNIEEERKNKKKGNRKIKYAWS